MAQTDIYIAKIDAMMDAYDGRAAGRLVKEIVAVFSGVDSHIRLGLDRYRTRVISPGMPVNYDNKGDLEKLKGKLLVLKEAERKDLAADPLRLSLVSVDDDIDECERLIRSGSDDDRRRYIDRMVRV